MAPLLLTPQISWHGVGQILSVDVARTGLVATATRMGAATPRAAARVGAPRDGARDVAVGAVAVGAARRTHMQTRQRSGSTL